MLCRKEGRRSPLRIQQGPLSGLSHLHFLQIRRFQAGKLADQHPFLLKFLLNPFSLSHIITPLASHSPTTARMADPHPLQQWFTTEGVQLHPSLYLAEDPKTGLSFYTSSRLPKDTAVIKVPRKLCITSHSAFLRIEQLLKVIDEYEGVDPKEEKLPKSDWILLYLVVCRLALEYLSSHPGCEEEQKLREVLTHLPYVAHIPTTIETALHFSPSELNLLCQTPLRGAADRRLNATICDYASAIVQCPYPPYESPTFAGFLRNTLEPITLRNTQSDQYFTHTYHRGLELWRWAESAFTSRSFPARLIGLDDNETAPILIPAYDTFNHARAHPVTWTHIAGTGGEGGMVEMTLNYETTEGGVQVWNNYGGKSNEEFLSGYGFVLDTTSEDTLALQLGGEGMLGKTHYWRIPPAPSALSEQEKEGSGFKRAKCPCPSLLEELGEKVLKGDTPPTAEQEQLELYGEVLETLEGLLLTKRKAFRVSNSRIRNLDINFVEHWPVHQPHEGWYREKYTRENGIRKHVWRMAMQYRKGQLELMNHAVDWTRSELGRVADALDAFDED